MNMNMNKRYLTLLTVASLTFPFSTAYASDDEYLFSLSLEQLLAIRITGPTLTSETLKTVPASVTSFTQERLSRMGIDYIYELIEIVPGFQSYQNGSFSGAFTGSSRGRNINNNNSEILLIVDGQRIDEPRISGSTVLFSYPIANIERIEFIRGPGAAIYGSNAMLGVINIISRSDENEASASVGSFNRKQAHFLASHSIDEVDIDAFAYIKDDQGDDFIVPDTFSANSVSTQDPHTDVMFELKASWQTTQIKYTHHRKKARDFYEVGGLSDGFNEHDFRFDAISVKHDYKWSEINSWLWLGYRKTNFQDRSQILPNDALFTESGSNKAALLDLNQFKTHESRLQWHNDWRLNGQSDWQFGLEFRRIEVPTHLPKSNYDLSELGANFLSGIPNSITYLGSLTTSDPIQLASKRDIIGVYTQYQHSFTNLTHLTLGIRYDNFSDIGHHISPKIGLVHELGDHQTVKILYAEAFRAPTENQLNLVNNPVAHGNQNLNPETVNSYEVIWLGQWPTFNIIAGYFENHFENAIQRVPISGVLHETNVSQDPAKGIEFEVNFEPSQHWLLGVTYTHFTEQPSKSFREAEQLASFIVNYHWKNWNANLIASYSDERQSPISNNSVLTLNDYWLVSSKVMFSFDNGWKAYFQAKNLLDEEYSTPATNALAIEGIINRGREIAVGAIWKF
jgi:outer membrane cobalamin receptor